MIEINFLSLKINLYNFDRLDTALMVTTKEKSMVDTKKDKEKNLKYIIPKIIKVHRKRKRRKKGIRELQNRENS